MPSFNVNDGAAWRRGRAVYVNDGAAWRKSRKVFVHDGIAWRQVFSASRVVSPLVVSGSTGTNPNKPAVATVAILGDGRVSYSGTRRAATYSNWSLDAVADGVGSGYWVKMVQTDGDLQVYGEVLNTWLQIGSGRSWSVGVDAGEDGQAGCQVLMSPTASDSDATTSNVFYLNATGM